MINQLWIQGCTPGLDGIDWQDSQRVRVGETEPFQLITTQIDFQNDSTEPDCVNGRVGSSTFTQAVEAVNQEVALANYQASNFGSYNEDGFAVDVPNLIPFKGPFLPTSN